MSIHKLEMEDVEKIKAVLERLNISSKRITIDFNDLTVETEEDPYDVKDILEIEDSISQDREKELSDHVKEAREEWDL
jgi:ABC-type phosphate transport system auxiliary subunit